MVQFGKKLMHLRNAEWESFYLNYKDLKRNLKRIVVESQVASPRSKEIYEEEFKRHLDEEIEKIVLFFLGKQGEFACRLSELRKNNSTLDNSDIIAIRELTDGYRVVGTGIVQLLQYAEVNATGLRKILKKHDKHVKDSKITGTYLASRVDEPYSHLQTLYHCEGVEAIVCTIRQSLEYLRKLEYDLLHRESMASVSDDSIGSKPYLFRSISEVEPVLLKIAAARRRFQQSLSFVKTFAVQSLIFEQEMSPDEEELSGYESLMKARKPSKTSRFLNHLNTFFYMMNYYIVAPTSGDYAILLGGNAALSGVIIGMTPLAALVSAVLYSWWANRSYKDPLLFSICCLIVGNFLYAIALTYDALWMVLAGRLLTGFGGARAINRRYIADNYRRDELTAGSAMFVTAGALGMSAGPGLSSILDFIPGYEVAGLKFTVETSPGWVMLFIWLLYLVATVFLFKEPNRNNQNLTASTKELQYLLEKGNNSEGKLEVHPTTVSSSLLNNVPVVTTLFIYFALKLTLECLLSSSATVTASYFQWSSTIAGIYLAILGLLMFPTNIAVSCLSNSYEDRDLILLSEGFLLIGSIGIIAYTSSYSAWQYIIFSVLVFISSNVLEGVNMALLSKTLPRSLARGTFNSGLLATEAGTLGRTVGDNLVTVVGLGSVSGILNYTFIPVVCLMIIIIAITWKVYDDLIPSEENE